MHVVVGMADRPELPDLAGKPATREPCSPTGPWCMAGAPRAHTRTPGPRRAGGARRRARAPRGAPGRRLEVRRGQAINEGGVVIGSRTKGKVLKHEVGAAVPRSRD